MSEHNGTPRSVPAAIRVHTPEILTPVEVVEILVLPDVRSLERLVRLGVIPAIKGVGKEHRFLRDSIVKALERLETKELQGAASSQPRAVGVRRSDLG